MGCNPIRWFGITIMYKQLDIYWVDLEPTKGSETQKKRPCVIVQSDLLNKGSRTLIVTPLLRAHKTWPFVVNITKSDTNGLDENRHVNLKQLRAVDVSRIDNKQGSLEEIYLAEIEKTLKIILFKGN